MIIANIPHKGAQLTVEVTGTFTTSNGVKMAVVRALAGRPFSAWTHGGWADSDSANFPAHLLRNVAVSVELPQPANLTPANIPQE